MAGTLLAPLLALAGQCFAGEVEPGSRDVHCFTSVYGGQHVRDVHKITKSGRILYQGETMYSVEGGEVTFTYLISIGGIGRGIATLGPGDWRFIGMMRATPADAPKPFLIRWQWSGGHAYSVRSGGETVTYRRTSRQ